jgi:PKD repeat protein
MGKFKVCSLLVLMVMTFTSCKKKNPTEPLPDLIPEFDVNNSMILKGDQVQFQDESLGDPEFWSWTFTGGNPRTSTEQNPMVTYPDTGNFSVQLTISRAGDETRESITKDNFIRVASSLTVDFSVDQDSITQGTSIQFTDASMGADSWSWTFEGGNPSTSTDQNPVVTYPNPGIFDVTLEVTGDGETIAKTEEDLIKVRTKVIAGFEATTVEINTGEQITFSDTSAGPPDEWNWTFEGGTPSTSDAQNPVVTYSEAGMFDVTLVAIRGQDADTVIKTDYITSLVPLSVLISADQDSIVSGDTVRFTDNSEGMPQSWIWTFEGGTPSSSNQQNPEIRYTTVGNFDVTLQIMRGSDSETLLFEDYIKVREPLNVGFNTPNTSATKGDTLQFFDTTTGNPTEWYWEFEGGEPATSTVQNPKVVYKEIGDFNVFLEAKRGQLDESETTKVDYIAIAKRLSPQFSVNPINVLIGDSVQYTDNTTGGPNNWLWSFNGANIAQSTEQNPKVVYNAVGDYGTTLRAFYNDTFEEETVNPAINVYDTVTSDFDMDSLNMVGAQYSFSEQSTGRITDYSWEFESGNPLQSISTSGTVNYSTPGYYNAELAVINPVDADVLFKSNFVEVLPAGLMNTILVYHDFRNSTKRDKLRGFDYDACLNCTSVTGTNGDTNGAISTGVSGLRIDPTNTDAIFNEMSLSVWVKTADNGSTNKAIIERYKGSSDFGIVVSILNGQVRLTGRDRSGNSRDAGTSANSIADNQWHHIVATLSPTSEWKLYIDGVQVISTDFNHNIDPVVNGQRIAVGHSDTSLQGLQAEYDNVMLWGRPLTASEIQALFNHQGSSY